MIPSLILFWGNGQIDNNGFHFIRSEAVLLPAHTEILELLVLLHTVARTLPPQPRRFDPTKRRRQVRQGTGMNAHHTAFPSIGDAQHPVHSTAVKLRSRNIPRND